MEYRFLGRSGLQVSAIGFGNMINHKPEDEEENVAIVKSAFDHGVNFFDTAENYQAGEAEEALGRAFKKLNLPREQLVVSTKIINRVDGKGNAVNRTSTLSRKHVLDGTDASLKRLQLDYVDVIFAHTPDPDTSVEELCRGFNQVIEDGKAFYWATSNFTTVQIQEIVNTCDRLGLHRPIAEQLSYSMLNRKALEVDFAPILDKVGYGTTVYSPLAGGVLTGKYNDAIPEVSRVNQGLGWFPKQLTDMFYNQMLSNEKTMTSLRGLGSLATELGCTQAQLALAWALRNKVEHDVSTALIGARNVKQLDESFLALEIVKKFTPELDEKIEKILDNRPAQNMDWRKWGPHPNRR